MKKSKISRRKFISTTALTVVGTSVFGIDKINYSKIDVKPKNEVISIVKVKDGNIQKAVEEAIDLLGGIRTVTKGKNSILLKPNLVEPSTKSTTKLEVIKTIAELIQKSGKDVLIGEGSAAAASFNSIDNEAYRTKKKDILDGMQQYVFDKLGYAEMAKSLKIPLINLHSGEMVDISLKNGKVADYVRINRYLNDVDLVCSVPMMKTHVLATVTLAMKNLIGCYPGTEYYSVRSWLHDRAAEKGSIGVAFEIIDMNQALKTGLSIIDATSAMEGNGPSSGNLIDLGLIIAGTSPLATDMVGATIMGFEFKEIPKFGVAHSIGMTPTTLDEIEVRGLKIEQCRHNFLKPVISNWSDINKTWGVKEI